jgi:hypothetical protein
MRVYVAEINGRAIAAFNAENDTQAEGRASTKPFRGDLTVLENEDSRCGTVRTRFLFAKPYPRRRLNLMHLGRKRSRIRKLTWMTIG